MAGEVKTITIKEVDGRPWHKPESTQEWFTVVIEEYPSEPIKFIQDTSKDAPAPEVGKAYEGMTYTGDKGIKFYASGGKFTKRSDHKPQYSKPSTGFTPKKEYQPRDDCAIQAQWAIGQAVKACTEQGIFEEDAIEDLAKKFFAMIDRIKVGNKTDNEPSDDDMDEAIKNGKPIELSEIPFGN